MLDKARAKRGLEPADASAGRLFKRARPAFLSSSAIGDIGRFHARPAAKPPGSGSSGAVAAVAAAAAASASTARKRARDTGVGKRDGKGLAFGAGLVSRTAGGGGRPLPTTLASLMEMAKREPDEFAKVGRGRGGGERERLSALVFLVNIVGTLQ